jgi:hypothetical protein
LRPSFGTGNNERGLTLTFGLLGSLIKFLVALTFIWALAASVLQTARLIAYIPVGFPGKGVGFWAQQAGWLAPLVSVFVYAPKAFGATMLIGLAAAMLGGLLGFLFAVPRPVSEAAPPSTPPPSTPTLHADGPAGIPQVAQAGAAMPRAATPHPARAWESSTNLTQISDWLTKIIVGVGLVEAATIYSRFEQLSTTLSDQLFDGAAGSRLVIPAVMIAGAIIGFLYAYLFTQLFVAGLIASTDPYFVSLSEIQRAVATLSIVPPASAAIARPIGTDPGTPPSLDQPTQLQRQAADVIARLPLAELTDPVQILAWARSHALMDDYQQAAEGYRRLLSQVRAPEVLAEAARVFSENNQPSEAENALTAAVNERDKVSPEVRFRITFDAASLALYEPPPGGYRKALELLDEKTLIYDPAGWLHVLRACANGQRYRYELLNASEDDKRQVRAAVLDDIKLALNLAPGHRDWVRYLWDPNAPDKPPVGSPSRDDDLEIFFDNPEFKTLLG